MYKKEERGNENILEPAFGTWEKLAKDRATKERRTTRMAALILKEMRAKNVKSPRGAVFEKTKLGRKVILLLHSKKCANLRKAFYFLLMSGGRV